MVGKEDPVAESTALGHGPGNRKLFWRSSSWSASRTSPENGDNVDSNGIIGNVGGHNRRFPAPLTPRAQHSSKARSCLPPLQPLAIAHRSLDEWPKAGSDDIGEWLQPPTPRGDVSRSGERLKLDLSSIQQNSEKNGCGLVRRDKIAFFDNECSKVAEHIYLGGDMVARDKNILKHNGITHVLNCVGFVCAEYFKDDFMYRTLWLQDTPSEDITSILYDVFDYFEDVREQGGRVFVHCCQGVSRSTSLVIAYRMWREGQSFDDAFQYVKAARGIADPNMGFACQLLQCQKRVHAFPLSPSSLLRLYRIAPHSPYDPVHLVPKMLNDPSPSALDSRGAFIIHVPSSIYVWIGKSCDAIMERDARGAVNQIVRYERVQGPIIMIKEGSEPPYFWDAFFNFLPSMDKSNNGIEVGKSSCKICPGERKVDSYDVDFEIFQKAIKGGFVPPFASSDTEHETCLPARESSWSVLRRKFARGNMKEFVSATKICLSRIYPDSSFALGLDNGAIRPSPSSSSASSTSYLSPDSISSDSSNSSKYFSESPRMSPNEGSLPTFSTVTTTSSNLSLLSPRFSPQPSSFTLELNSQSVSSRSPISLAERRGNLSKSLKLPVMNDDTRLLISPKVLSLDQECSRTKDTCSVPRSLAERRGGFSKSFKLPVMIDDKRETTSCTASTISQEESIRPKMSHHNFSLRESENVDNTLASNNDFKYDERHSSRTCDVQIPVDEVAAANSSRDEAEISDLGDISGKYILGENQSSAVCSGMRESSSVQCDLLQPLISRWPSLEKVAVFDKNDINSKAAFVIVGSGTGSHKSEHRILYFWIGRSFSYDKSQLHFKTVGDGEEIDWNRVSVDVLTEMGLPKDTPIKIVKEDQEPIEFLTLLSSL